jgi:D-alanine transaminase
MSAKLSAPAFLNGEFLPVSEARVSVLDRGFMFGDGVYELIPVYGRRLFRLSQHLARLSRSLAEIRLPNPYPDVDWRAILSKLIDQAEEDDLTVYLQVTRGIAPRDHAFPQAVSPTAFAMATPLRPLPAEVLLKGIAAVTVDDIRWRRCDIKSVSLLANVLLRQQALEQGADEAILIRAGYVTEGAASNVFVAKDDVMVTPPRGPDILAGITRDLVLELMAREGLPCQESVISANDLFSAQEVWVTSSSKEIVAVTRLNRQPVGEGKPGSRWVETHHLLQAYKSELQP